MFVINLMGYLPRVNDEVVPLVSLASKLHDVEGRHARPIRTPQLALVRELAPSIRSWTEGRRLRSTREELLKLRWLFYFLDEIRELRPELPADIKASHLDESSGIDFADWLRRQVGISSGRMGVIYSTVASQLSRYVGRQVWPPCPFFNTERPGEVDQGGAGYTKAQYVALLRMAKAVVADFMRERRQTIRIVKEIEKHDPGRAVAYQARTDIGWKCQLRDTVVHARENLLIGEPPPSPSSYSWTRSCIVPTKDFVAALFLLVLLRSGANEQPVLDIVPGRGLKPGPWLHDNPFGFEYRTVLLWKNRAGTNRPNQKTRVPLAVRSKPTFYPSKLLRYQELLGCWCRAAIASAERSGQASDAFLASAAKAVSNFWIYWETGKWRALTGTRTHSAINALIEKSTRTWPALLDNEGKPIQYSARAIRDAYLDFVVMKSGFSVATAQRELAHSEHSNAIHGYLSKKWARTYSHNSLREFHSATVAVLKAGVPLSADAIKRRLKPSQDEVRDEPTNLTMVRYGFGCVDPAKPPENILKTLAAGEECPAAQCHDCYHARCFTSSLPELAVEILNLRTRRDQVSPHLWIGSSDDIRLKMLEEILERFPEPTRLGALRKAEWLDVPTLEYTPR